MERRVELVGRDLTSGVRDKCTLTGRKRDKKKTNNEGSRMRSRRKRGRRREESSKRIRW